jgi:hypothetical protein
MSEINHFKVFILFSVDMTLNGQLRWIACMRRKLLGTRFIYIVIEDSN